METRNSTHATMLLSPDDMLLAAVSTEDLTLLEARIGELSGKRFQNSGIDASLRE